MSAISDLEVVLERCSNEEKTGRRTLNVLIDFLCEDSFWTVNEMSTSCKQRFIALAKLMEDKPTPSVPTGWKLVPIEPTPVMKTAGIGVEVYQDSPPSTDCLTWGEVEAIYSAMIAAAPEAKP